MSADIDETMDASLPPEQEVERVSCLKAAAAARVRAPEDIIIASDTIVVIDGRVLGKPHSTEEAKKMLRSLSGRAHQVMTGLCVRQGERVHSEVSITAVHFRALSDREIDAYVASGEPMDKAGAYGIQKLGALLVERVEGDYFTVMGLPVCRLGQALREFGVSVL